MKGFGGFPPGKIALTCLPTLFFTELLPNIDDLVELKVTLYVFWLLWQRSGQFPYVSRRQMLADPLLLTGLSRDGQPPEQALQEGLERAVARGTLLHLQVQLEDGVDEWYFLHSEKGRRAMEALREGEVQATQVVRQPVIHLAEQRPNIFVLYEQNIGLLSPLIVERLMEAERSYPAEWIEEAFAIAVASNNRRWNYIQAILDRWAQEGKSDEARQRDRPADRRRYIEGEYADLVKH